MPCLQSRSPFLLSKRGEVVRSIPSHMGNRHCCRFFKTGTRNPSGFERGSDPATWDAWIGIMDEDLLKRQSRQEKVGEMKSSITDQRGRVCFILAMMRYDAVVRCGFLCRVKEPRRGKAPGSRAKQAASHTPGGASPLVPGSQGLRSWCLVPGQTGFSRLLME